MQKLLREYMDELNKRQKKNRKIVIAVLVLVVVVFGSVMGILTQYGVAMTGKPQCGLEEHTHTEECYEKTLVCGLEESESHTHTDECYEETLVCGKEEHIHTDACYIDAEADVEDQAAWDSQYAEVKWKGAWGEDLVTAAQMQIGYQESTDNYTDAADGSQKGYTRYGHFAGDMYADWDAAFVNFCLHYAGMEGSGMFPTETLASAWYEKFVTTDNGANSAYVATPENYMPAAGDIVFFQKENEETDMQMGIVSAVNEGNRTIAVIEGNNGNEVKETEYSLDDAHIVHYIKISAAESEYKNLSADSMITPDETSQNDTLQSDTEQNNTLQNETSQNDTEQNDTSQNDTEQNDTLQNDTQIEDGIRTLSASGADYTVTVTFTEEAAIPDNAVLDVREIEPDSEEYQQYYEQSLVEMGVAELSFARYFDITFLVNGQKIEPTAPVDVTISYQDDVEIEGEDGGKAVHFADEETTEVLDAEVDTDENAFTFTQESFSVTGTVGVAAKVYYQSSISNTSQLAGKQFLITDSASSSIMTSKAVTSSSNVKALLAEAFAADESTVYTNATVWTFVQNGNSFRLMAGSSSYLNCDTNGNLTLVNNVNSATNFTVNVSGGKITISYTVSSGGNKSTTFYINPAGKYVVTSDYDNQTCFIGSSTQKQLTLYTEDENKADHQYIVLNPYNVGKDENASFLYNFKVDGVEGTKAKSTKRCRIKVADQLSTTETVTITLPNDEARQSGFKVIANEKQDHTIEDNSTYKWKLIGWYNIGDGKYYDVSKGSVPAKVDLSNNNVFYAHWIAADTSLNNGGTNSGSSLGGIYNTNDTSSFATIQMFDYDEMFNLSEIGVTQHGTSYERWQIREDNLDPFTFFAWNSHNSGNYPDLAGVAKTGSYGKGTVGTESDELLQRLFNENANVYNGDGVRYLGTGNYLFSYDEGSGYYEYDSSLHAASYNMEEQKFYVYNKPQYKKGEENKTPIFLPLNGEDTSYGDVSSQTHGETNYWFGMKTELNFWLPDNSSTSGGGNQNKSEDMLFEFSGDDDVWVFVDGKLALDLSGIHGAESGTINFSTGAVTTNGVETSMNFDAGSHTMTIYYMERGRGGSNCRIKFNILPAWNYKGKSAQNVTVEKKWKDSDGKELESDEEITAELLETGTKSDEETLNEQNGWNYTWKYLDASKEYKVQEVIDDTISNKYVTTTESSSEKCDYWIEDSKLKDGSIIILGNGKTESEGGSVLNVEDERIEFVLAEFAVNGDILKDESEISGGSKWRVHIVQENDTISYSNDENGNYIQFKLESMVGNGESKYLCIREKDNGIQLVSEEKASILHFSEKGNLTGSSTNRLVCEENGNGFEIVDKADTANDAIDPATGKGSYRRVHVYQYEEQAGTHTTYTITNQRVEADIVLKKVNKNDLSKLLKGAEFSLYDDENCTETSRKMVLQTGDNGEAVIKNLPVGTYYLKETKAPDGYQLLENSIIITVSKDGNDNAKGTVEISGLEQQNDWQETSNMAGKVTIQVSNTMLYSLPSAGGSGIFWYLISGMLLMSAGALFLYKNKRKEVQGS